MQKMKFHSFWTAQMDFLTEHFKSGFVFDSMDLGKVNASKKFKKVKAVSHNLSKKLSRHCEITWASGIASAPGHMLLSHVQCHLRRMRRDKNDQFRLRTSEK